MMIIPAMIIQSFVLSPVSVATTEPEAATCDEVRQNRARMLRTAEKTELNFPNLLPTTSGIVTAIAFAKGEIPKVHRLNLFSAMFTDTVTWLELEGKKMIFLDMKGTEFKQLLSIAQAKQKYSHTVAGSTGK